MSVHKAASKKLYRSQRSLSPPPESAGADRQDNTATTIAIFNYLVRLGDIIERQYLSHPMQASLPSGQLAVQCKPCFSVSALDQGCGSVSQPVPRFQAAATAVVLA